MPDHSVGSVLLCVRSSGCQRPYMGPLVAVYSTQTAWTPAEPSLLAFTSNVTFEPVTVARVPSMLGPALMAAARVVPLLLLVQLDGM